MSEVKGLKEDPNAAEFVRLMNLTNYIPIYQARVKKVYDEFATKRKEFYKLVDEINKQYIEAGMPHIIHLRDDDTINEEGCCRSCCWHP